LNQAAWAAPPSVLYWRGQDQMVTSAAERTVFVVDDDEAALDSLVMLLKSDGLKTRGFASAHDLLAIFDPEMRGCVITYTSLQGAAMIVFGVLALVYKYDQVGPKVTDHVITITREPAHH